MSSGVRGYMGESEKQSSNYTHAQLVDVLGNRVEGWAYEHSPAHENARFVTQLAYWAFETFTDTDSEGEYKLFQKFDILNGFPHEELPQDLKPVIMQEYYGEVYPGNNNSVFMVSTTDSLETDPVIPKWEEISMLQTYQEQLAAIKNDPEVMAGLVPSSFEVIPGVDIIFKPDFHYDWGLHIHADQTGVWIAPFGKVRKTRTAFDFCVEMKNNQAALSRMAAELILLCVKYCNTWQRNFTQDQLELLDKRIMGTDQIDITHLQLRPKPGNAMVNLLVSKALESTTQED